jgi:hypothetical protein
MSNQYNTAHQPQHRQPQALHERQQQYAQQLPHQQLSPLQERQQQYAPQQLAHQQLPALYPLQVWSQQHDMNPQWLHQNQQQPHFHMQAPHLHAPDHQPSSSFQIPPLKEEEEANDRALKMQHPLAAGIHFIYTYIQRERARASERARERARARESSSFHQPQTHRKNLTLSARNFIL